MYNADLCICILNKEGFAEGKDLVVTVMSAMGNMCKTCVILLNLMLYQ